MSLLARLSLLCNSQREDALPPSSQFPAPSSQLPAPSSQPPPPQQQQRESIRRGDEHNPTKAKQPPGVTRRRICFWGRASGSLEGGSLGVSHPAWQAGWPREPGVSRVPGAEPGDTALKRLTQPECRGKAWPTRAEPWRRPRVGRVAEAVSGRGLGTAGCVALVYSGCCFL